MTLTPLKKRLALGLLAALAALFLFHGCIPDGTKPALRDALKASSADLVTTQKAAKATDRALKAKEADTEALITVKAQDDIEFTRIIKDDPIASEWAEQPLPPGVANWLYRTPNPVRGPDSALYTVQGLHGDSRTADR